MLPISPRILLHLAVWLLVTSAAAPVRAVWGPFRIGVGYEASRFLFDELAEYTRFRDGGGNPDFFESLRYEYNDAAGRGFRVHVELENQFALVWSRQSVHSRYRVRLDGAEVVDNPNQDPAIEVGNVDLRIDTISFTYRPVGLERLGMAPVARVGIGWILQSQQKPLRPTPGHLPVDFSDSDPVLEASVGLEARYRFLRGGLDLRTVHWRWDPSDVDSRVPRGNTHAVSWGGWLGVSF